MKCPGCLYVCSDLRDICPRCYTDLRPHKKQLRLPITNARASYDELLKKIAPSPAPAKATDAQQSRSGSKSEPQSKSFTGTLKGLFGAFSRAPAEIETPRRPPTAESTAAAAVSKLSETTSTPPEVELDRRTPEALLGSELAKELEGLTPKGPEVLDFSQFDEKVEGIIDRILDDSEIVAHEGSSAKSHDYDEFEIEIVEEQPDQAESPLGEAAPPVEAQTPIESQAPVETPAPNEIEQPEAAAPPETEATIVQGSFLESAAPEEAEVAEPIDSTESEEPLLDFSPDQLENLPPQIDFSYEEAEQETPQSLAELAPISEITPPAESEAPPPESPVSAPEGEAQQFFETPPDFSPEVENLQPSLAPQPESYLEPAPKAVIDPALVEIMFSRVQVELEEHALESGSEINLQQLVDLSDREDINLYFDLSHDAILNPDSEKILDEKFTASTERKVESEAVVKYHLSSIESMISAPVLTLKSAALRARDFGRRRAAQHEQAFRPASRRERVLAGAVDAFTVLCATALLTLLYFASVRGSSVGLQSFSLTQPLAALPYLSVFGALLVLCSFIYPLLAFCSVSATVGMLNIGTRLAREDGKTLRFRNAFVHAALTPLYLVSCGFVAPLFGATGFTEKLARTRVVRFEGAPVAG